MVPEEHGHDRWSPRRCLGFGAPKSESEETDGGTREGVEISQRLVAAESDYQQLARRIGGQRASGDGH
jgi:hypothetical protein